MRRGPFHHPARVHDGDLVRASRNDAQVMGDQDHRHPPPALLAGQQVQDLSLHGDVECRGGLIGDQQFGFAGQGDGNGHALAHAAGELVRILL